MLMQGLINIKSKKGRLTMGKQFRKELDQMLEEASERDEYHRIIQQVSEHREYVYRVSRELPGNIGYQLLSRFDLTIEQVQDLVELKSRIENHKSL